MTVTEAGPPDEPTDNDDGVRVNVHGAGDGLVGELLSHDVTTTPSARSKGKWNKDLCRITASDAESSATMRPDSNQCECSRLAISYRGIFRPLAEILPELRR